MVDHSIPIVTLVEEIFGHARAGYAHAFFQVLLPSPQQFGLPIPLLSQFRSSIRQLHDKQLQELCDAIDFVKKSQKLHPQQIVSALQIHHPDPCELPDLA